MMNETDKMKKKQGKKIAWTFARKKKSKQKEIYEIPNIYDIKLLLEYKNINLKPRVNQNKTSKLSPSLLDILKKSVALGNFLEYLKEAESKNLLDFWLEAETFRMITEKKYNRRMTRTDSVSSHSSNSPRLSPLRKKHTESKQSLECKCGLQCYCEGAKRLNKSDSILSETTHSVTETNNRLSQNTFETPERTYNFKSCTLNGETNFSHNEILKTVFHSESPSKSPSRVKSDSDLSGTTLEEFRQRARTRSFIVDAVTIYTKYISLNADFPISLPSLVRQNIEGVICKDKNYLDPNCFVEAQESIFQTLSRFHAEFLQTTNMISYQLKVLNSDVIKLQDILYHEAILFYFTEFLDQQHCKDALEFYITTENFEEDIDVKINDNCYIFENAVSDAMYIYERYFSMKCENQLIGDDKLRIVLENNICREDGPQSNCFCIPMAYAWTVLSEIYLPAFLSSDVYKSYISHLKNTSTNLDDIKSCSSRSSIQSHDDFPLLARTDSKSNILEDENGLDEFWFKPIHHQSTNRLALGHVNEFGVFNSGMEPHPFASQDTDSSVSKLGKAMKNLIRGETQEETEQMAWERARKIIADIQMQTQS